jgi:hypothetical protein
VSLRRVASLRVAAIALLIFGGGVLVGRVSAGSTVKSVGLDCSGQARASLDLPPGLAAGVSLGNFSQCDQANASRLASSTARFVEVFRSPTGTQKVARWYFQCGYPEGLSARGGPRPQTCH